jgi:hypothetical protein
MIHVASASQNPKHAGMFACRRYRSSLHSPRGTGGTIGAHEPNWRDDNDVAGAITKAGKRLVIVARSKLGSQGKRGSLVNNKSDLPTGRSAAAIMRPVSEPASTKAYLASDAGLSLFATFGAVRVFAQA